MAPCDNDLSTLTFVPVAIVLTWAVPLASRLQPSKTSTLCCAVCPGTERFPSCAQPGMLGREQTQQVQSGVTKPK